MRNMHGNKLALVNGGASLIGSHLVDNLLKKGMDVKVADDFSSGKLENRNGIKTASVRIYTASSPRENETHEIMALMAEALIEPARLLQGNHERRI